MKRLQREYPNINGFPVRPHELELPPSMLDTDRQESWNNHHLCFTASKMARFVLTQTWRDLDKNQVQMPKDTHAVLHDRYTEYSIPTPTDLMDEIDEAWQTGEALRYGSAAHPTYRQISEDLIRRIHSEYNQLNEETQTWKLNRTISPNGRAKILQLASANSWNAIGPMDQPES